jgi:hypothetical protein
VTISAELEAQILRYYHVERWRPGTIARQLGVHHGTVARVLAQAGLPRLGRPARPSQIDPYLPFIRQTLEKFPTLNASRLYAMVRERPRSFSPCRRLASPTAIGDRNQERSCEAKKVSAHAPARPM